MSGHAIKITAPGCVEIPKASEPHKPLAITMWIEADHPYLVELEIRDEDGKVAMRADVDLDALEDVVTIARSIAARNERRDGV
jgi:hypothetical protein